MSCPLTQAACCAVPLVLLQPHDLLRMERIILNLLDFGMSGPTCYTFLHLLAQVTSSPAASTSCLSHPTPCLVCTLLCQHTLQQARVRFAQSLLRPPCYGGMPLVHVFISLADSSVPAPFFPAGVQQLRDAGRAVPWDVPLRTGHA